MHAAIWTVPAVRMKGGVEHCVPLSSAAVEMLRAIMPRDALPRDVVFGVQAHVPVQHGIVATAQAN